MNEQVKTKSSSLEKQRFLELMSDNERLGARCQQLELENAQLKEAVEQLSPWRDFVKSRLDVQDLSAAHGQVDALWSAVNRLGMPSHRMVSFIGRIVFENKLGRVAREKLVWLLAIKRS